MYLASPIELSFSSVIAFSALIVIALVAVIRFFPRRTVIACRITIALLWTFGTFVAVYGGFKPGLTIEPLTIYPWFGVVREVSIMTTESLCLYFIICYRDRGPSISRLFTVTAVFAILAVWAPPPTDLPGYMYANFNFIIVTLFILVFGFTLNLLGYIASFAARQRTA